MDRSRESAYCSSRARPGPSQDPVPADEETDDDYCVYTYKGGSSSSTALLADLPSSFYNFDQNHQLDSAQPVVPLEDFNGFGAPGLPGTSAVSDSRQNGFNVNGRAVGAVRLQEQAVRNGDDLFSPDMDFLEMDFDPGPGPEEDEDIDSGDALASSSSGGLGIDINGENDVLNRYILEHAQQSQRRLIDSAIPVDVTDSPPLAPPEPQPGPSTSCFPSVSGTGNTSILRNQRPGLLQGSGNGHKNSSNTDSPVASTSAHIVQLHSLALEPAAGRPQQLTCKTIGGPVASSSGTRSTDESSVDRASGSPSQTCSAGLVLRLVKSNTLPQIGNRSSSIANGVETGGKSESLPVVNNAEMSDTVEMEIGSLMIWTVAEAVEKSLSQIGTSACGATAVCSVLRALEVVPVLDTGYVNDCVSTRLRDNDAEIPEYLFSRASAGSTHEDLIKGCSKATNGLVFGRFFQVPPRLTEHAFAKWLLHWICRGAIPVLTRNLQHVTRSRESRYCSAGDLPDAWHHQMVHGMSASAGVYLTNPVECVPFSEILPQLSTPSVLLVRRADIISRMRPRTDLRRLGKNHNGDSRWNSMNVLGQVGNILLEGMPLFHGTSLGRRVRTSHVQIPASYKGGVTLFISTTNEASLQLLQSAQELN